MDMVIVEMACVGKSIQAGLSQLKAAAEMPIRGPCTLQRARSYAAIRALSSQAWGF